MLKTVLAYNPFVLMNGFIIVNAYLIDLFFGTPIGCRTHACNRPAYTRIRVSSQTERQDDTYRKDCRSCAGSTDCILVYFISQGVILITYHISL